MMASASFSEGKKPNHLLPPFCCGVEVKFVKIGNKSKNFVFVAYSWIIFIYLHPVHVCTV
jgi:hypothetical protein